jgi:hypothetical protein
MRYQHADSLNDNWSDPLRAIFMKRDATRGGRLLVSAVSLLACCSLLVGCSGVLKKRPPAKKTAVDLIGEPIPPEQAKNVLSELSKNYAYGTGIGDTALNVGAVVAFPPYAIYLVGNAVLALSGYETITPSTLLPKQAGEAWGKTYDTIASGPGRVVAAMAGHEFRSEAVKEQKLQRIFAEIEQAKQTEEEAEQ